MSPSFTRGKKKVLTHPVNESVVSVKEKSYDLNSSEYITIIKEKHQF